jgi:outer membrane protein assembly factor BamB
MRNRVLGVVVLVALASAPAWAGDWPQWRGPRRTGVAAGDERLADAWDKRGPKRLWRSEEEIPGDGRGGYGSVVVADGRAYVYVNWRYRVPLRTRTLTSRGLRKLGLPPKPLPKALRDAVERARLGDQRAELKGKALREWAGRWVDDHLDANQKKAFGGYVSGRLRRGPAAMDLDVLGKLAGIRDRTFESQAKLDAWLADHAVDGKARTRVQSVIATTRDEANDVVVCLDADDGRSLWKAEYPGHPHGHGTSSTPCVGGGRVYAAGGNSTVYCLDAASGEEVWQTAVHEKGGRGTNASPVVVDGAVVVAFRPLVALDADDGHVLWRQKAVGTPSSSPVVLRGAGRTLLLCNGAGKKVACVDAADGNVLWTAPGGGPSTVAVADGHMVVAGDNSEAGLRAYRVSAAGAEPLWTVACHDRGASAVIWDRAAYFVGGGGNAQILCVPLATGQVAWEQKLRATEISSPAAADGKLLFVANNGRSLRLVKASREKYTPLAEARAAVMRCTSPAIAGGRLFVRERGHVACYDLRGR